MPVASNVAVVAFAWGGLLDFVPTFVGSTLRTWPGAFVHIYLARRRSFEHPGLDLVRKYISDKFAFRYWDVTGRQKTWAARRWAADPPWPRKFAYIAPAEAVHAVTRTPLETFHQQRIRETRLPYSNAVRPVIWRGTKQLTGGHFIETRAYWRRLRHHLPRGSDRLWGHRDEHVLYELMSRAFGGVTPYDRAPQHGIRLTGLKTYQLASKLLPQQRGWVDVASQFANDAAFRDVLATVTHTAPVLAALDACLDDVRYAETAGNTQTGRA